MKLFFQILTAIMVLLILASCATEKKITSEEIYAKFGTEYIYNWNIDSTHILAINKKGKISSVHLAPLEYFIYDIERDSVLFKETITGGTAKWVNPSQIQVNIVPGNITDDEELENLKYKFDILKNKKITNGE